MKRLPFPGDYFATVGRIEWLLEPPSRLTARDRLRAIIRADREAAQDGRWVWTFNRTTGRPYRPRYRWEVRR